MSGKRKEKRRKIKHTLEAAKERRREQQRKASARKTAPLPTTGEKNQSGENRG